MKGTGLLDEIRQFPCVKKECVLDTMKKYALLFDDMKPDFGVPLTIDKRRVHVGSIGQMKERNNAVYAGDVKEMSIPAVIRQRGFTELAPRLVVRFGTIDGKVGVPTILHEMIHMYQICMRRCFIGVRRVPEFMTARSEEALTAKIVNECPEAGQHLGVTYAIATMSPKESLKCHDMLFLSKSMQLDCEFGYPLGTVCGYGLREYIKHSDSGLEDIV